MTSARASNAGLTGRKILLIFACFFGVIFAANGFLLRMALQSWSGAETTSAYRAGQLYERDRAEAQAQERSGVVAALEATRGRSDAAIVTVGLRDAAGAPLTGRLMRARLLRPVDQRLDLVAVLVERAPGQYEVEIPGVAAGQWDVIVEVMEGGRRAFRTRARVLLSDAS